MQRVYLMELRECMGLTLKGSFEGNHYLGNEKEGLLAVLIEPHCGTNGRYYLRADFNETFERWSVCMFEEGFVEGEFEDVLIKLKQFVRDKDKYIDEDLEDW